eukprot:529186_1
MLTLCLTLILWLYSCNSQPYYSVTCHSRPEFNYPLYQKVDNITQKSKLEPIFDTNPEHVYKHPFADCYLLFSLPKHTLPKQIAPQHFNRQKYAIWKLVHHYNSSLEVYQRGTIVINDSYYDCQKIKSNSVHVEKITGGKLQFIKRFHQSVADKIHILQNDLHATNVQLNNLTHAHEKLMFLTGNLSERNQALTIQLNESINAISVKNALQLKLDVKARSMIHLHQKIKRLDIEKKAWIQKSIDDSAYLMFLIAKYSQKHKNLSEKYNALNSELIGKEQSMVELEMENEGLKLKLNELKITYYKILSVICSMCMIVCCYFYYKSRKEKIYRLKQMHAFVRRERTEPMLNQSKQNKQLLKISNSKSNNVAEGIQGKKQNVHVLNRWEPERFEHMIANVSGVQKQVIDGIVNQMVTDEGYNSEKTH